MAIKLRVQQLAANFFPAGLGFSRGFFFESLNRPGVVQRVPEDLGSQIS
jgi:hypothetical protein